ncbi:MAG: hypothetical protein ACM33T_02965 [Solirubrobacterales bacterium]
MSKRSGRRSKGKTSGKRAARPQTPPAPAAKVAKAKPAIPERPQPAVHSLRSRWRPQPAQLAAALRRLSGLTLRVERAVRPVLARAAVTLRRLWRQGEAWVDSHFPSPLAVAEHRPSPERQEPDRAAAITSERALVLVREAMAAVPAGGTDALPADPRACAVLLEGGEGLDDYQALGYLERAFPEQRVGDGKSPALAAVALTLGRGFGRPGFAALTTLQAWRLLDPVPFEAVIAAELARVSEIARRVPSRKPYQPLAIAELDLIEHLFEALPPGRHRALLLAVMDLRELGERRVGLVRRFPRRVARALEAAGADAAATAAPFREFLEPLVRDGAYQPLAEAAGAALARIDKLVAPKGARPQAPRADIIDATSKARQP